MKQLHPGGLKIPVSTVRFRPWAQRLRIVSEYRPYRKYRGILGVWYTGVTLVARLATAIHGLSHRFGYAHLVPSDRFIGGHSFFGHECVDCGKWDVIGHSLDCECTEGDWPRISA